ncbi:MAG: STAS domain-containing protein [Tepidisphaeraceae bacterium]
MKLTLNGIEPTGIVKLLAHGPVTATELPADGKNPIEALLGPQWTTFRVLLDLAQVPYIDSSAIGWLIGTQKAFRDKGGSFAVYHIQPAVKQVLDLLKVGRVVPLCENEQTARTAVGG